MKSLICGSIAYDTIMVFHDEFGKHILPEQIHILNVAFLVPDMRREFGGCAGNIAYNLKMLGGEALVMATVGDDHQPYSYRMEKLGLDTTHVKHVEGTFCAQAFITTDVKDNQITAFHPGAMNYSHLNSVKDAGGIGLGIVSPDGRDGMMLHAKEFHEAGIPFIFDPGQGMPMFSGDELMEFIMKADYLTVNDYEARMLQEKTGKTAEELAKHVKALIITLGAEGSLIHSGGEEIRIPAVKPAAVIDPTGCGDAYRAGLLYGLSKDMDWHQTGRLASLLGSLKIANRGGQNHHHGIEEIRVRFRDAFGSDLGV